MSTEENKTIVRHMFEAFNRQDLASLDKLIASDYVDRPRLFKGLDSYKQHLAKFFESFPDSYETIEDIVAEGDEVWIRLKGTGTHRGESLGLAPTGRKITWEAFDIWRVVKGKVVELRHAAVDMDFYKQLGVIEYTEKGKKFFL